MMSQVLSAVLSIGFEPTSQRETVCVRHYGDDSVLT